MKAVVNWQNKNAMMLYDDKLHKYSFYLRTGIIDDYEIFIKEITETMQAIQKAYKIK